MSFMASFMNVGGPDLIIILLIILVLFGAKKLPELARGMGSAIKEFQKAKDEFSDELHSAGKTDAKTDVRTPAATVPRIENPPATSAEVRPEDQVRPGEPGSDRSDLIRTGRNSSLHLTADKPCDTVAARVRPDLERADSHARHA